MMVSSWILWDGLNVTWVLSKDDSNHDTDSVKCTGDNSSVIVCGGGC